MPSESCTCRSHTPSTRTPPARAVKEMSGAARLGPCGALASSSWRIAASRHLCHHPRHRRREDFRVLPRLIERVDGWAGGRLEAINSQHHRRRLTRGGKLAQLDPPADGALWSAGDPPPRPGCALEVLIDGEQALPR